MSLTLDGLSAIDKPLIPFDLSLKKMILIRHATTLYFCLAAQIAPKWWNTLCKFDTSWRFNSSPLKSYQNPIGKDRLPTIVFQGRAVKLLGVNFQQNPWSFLEGASSSDRFFQDLLTFWIACLDVDGFLWMLEWLRWMYIYIYRYIYIHLLSIRIHSYYRVGPPVYTPETMWSRHDMHKVGVKLPHVRRYDSNSDRLFLKCPPCRSKP